MGPKANGSTFPLGHSVSASSIWDNTHATRHVMHLLPCVLQKLTCRRIVHLNNRTTNLQDYRLANTIISSLIERHNTVALELDSCSVLAHVSIGTCQHEEHRTTSGTGIKQGTGPKELEIIRITLSKLKYLPAGL
jgi:hypothetical protein